MKKIILFCFLVVCTSNAMDYINTIKALGFNTTILLSRIEKQSAEIRLALAKTYFNKLIHDDFNTEEELIDSLNAFNAANKVNHQAVKDALKEKEQSESTYKELIVTDNPTKTTAKQFTKFKLELIEKNINTIINHFFEEEALEVNIPEHHTEYKQWKAARFFNAYKWSRSHAKAHPLYQQELHQALDRQFKLYKKQKIDIDELRAYATLDLLLGVNLDRYGSFVDALDTGDEQLIEVFLECGVNPNHIIAVIHRLALPLWAFEVITGNNSNAALILKKSKHSLTDRDLKFQNISVLYFPIAHLLNELLPDYQKKFIFFNKNTKELGKERTSLETIKLLLENNIVIPDTIVNFIDKCEETLASETVFKKESKEYADYTERIHVVRNMITDALKTKESLKTP